MKSIFEKINKTKLEMQDKFLTFSLKDTLKPDYQQNFNKKHFSKGCTLDINAEAEKKIAAVKEKAYYIINKCNKNPAGILEYIIRHGYKVKYLTAAKKLLSFVDETPGLICSASGLKGLYINIISGSKISFKSEPMFIFENNNTTISELLHDLYLWTAMDTGLPGFELKTRKLFTRYFIKGDDSLLKHIQINQMLMLKQAVSRDKEAIEFAIEFEKINKTLKSIHKNSLPEKIFI